MTTHTSAEHAVVAIYDSAAGAEAGRAALQTIGLAGEILTAANGAHLGGATGALATALAAIGVPSHAVVGFELEVKSGKLVLLARGAAELIDQAFALLGATGTTQITTHHTDASAPPGSHIAGANLMARDRILELLSDDEVASVSTAESKPRLAEGEEYLDLERLDQGVRRASGATPMGQVLPRKALHDGTWAQILTELKAPMRA